MVQDGGCIELRAALHIYCSLKLYFFSFLFFFFFLEQDRERESEREKDTEKEVSVSSPDNENKTGCMPSSGPWPKHISLAWTSYKQGNEKHMLEGKVRSEGLWVNDSRPKTFPLFFSCGLAVSNVIWTALVSHGGPCRASFPSPFPFFCPLSSSRCFFLGLLFSRGGGGGV